MGSPEQVGHWRSAFFQGQQGAFPVEVDWGALGKKEGLQDLLSSCSALLSQPHPESGLSSDSRAGEANVFPREGFCCKSLINEGKFKEIKAATLHTSSLPYWTSASSDFFSLYFCPFRTHTHLPVLSASFLPLHPSPLPSRFPPLLCLFAPLLFLLVYLPCQPLPTPTLHLLPRLFFF